MNGDHDDEARAAALETGRHLFAQECRFLVGAVRLAQLPDAALPEVAFAGRSNVGKSSLVNALTGRKTLARTSNTPGRTRQFNFFDLGHRLMLVDLPGWGYAAGPREDGRLWLQFMDRYFRGRAPLRRVCLLVDARHGLKDSDRDIMVLLDQAAVSYQAVLTKCDKLTPDRLRRRVADTATELAGHVAAHPEVVATSARTGLGIAELRAALAALAEPRQTD